jgi:hypothetical protein
MIRCNANQASASELNSCYGKYVNKIQMRWKEDGNNKLRAESATNRVISLGEKKK